MTHRVAKPDCIIVDMDGTLCDVTEIRHHVLNRPKNFDAFHTESVNMPPHPNVVSTIHEFKRTCDVVIVTARKHRWRHHTAMWLALNNIPSDAMFMRNDLDDRKDVEVKRDILATIREAWNPVLAIDDNPAIIALWRSEGIATMEIPGWY